MAKKDKIINYEYFHWGPFLYKTTLGSEELKAINKLCNKKNSNDVRKTLAGLIRHEYNIKPSDLFKTIGPYFHSYAKAYTETRKTFLANKIELVASWVNYMTKFEFNPVHSHDGDLSFVIYTQVPKGLKKEINKTVSNNEYPGAIKFIYYLNNSKMLLNQHTFIPVVGDFFIFPANLHHSVNPFKFEGERISVSGNLKFINT